MLKKEISLEKNKVLSIKENVIWFVDKISVNARNGFTLMVFC